MNQLTYNLTLNTQSTSKSIIDKSNLAQVQYNVNWDAVLPRKFQEYQLVWTLKTVNTATSINQNLFVDINFGASNTYALNQMSSKVGFVYPNVVQQDATHWSYFYQATIYDNPPVEISYPSNNVITVKFYGFDGITAPTQSLDYVLELSFTPINTDLLLR